LPLLIAPIAAGHADVATASPYHPLGGVGIVPLWRLFLSRSASWVYRRLLPVRLYTYTSCCRAYRASVARRLSFTDPGFLGITELMVSAILGGLRVVEVPAHLGGRSHGVSKMRTFQILFKHLALVSRVVLDRWHLLRRREVPSG
jgi:dolichol-phosphate mannosyltransferase